MLVQCAILWINSYSQIFISGFFNYISQHFNSGISLIILVLQKLGSVYRMTIKRQFRINEYMVLTLEEGQTHIYVGGQNFRQCKYLFLINPNETIGEDINSIDEASEKFNVILEGEEVSPSDFHISPQEEFVGHCSNLQAWAALGYDTRLLHSNLAFPLLKRLTELGDAQAKKVFKEEILLRFMEGIDTASRYLQEEGYLEYLSSEELLSAVRDEVEYEALKKFEKMLKQQPKDVIFPDTLDWIFRVRKGRISLLRLAGYSLKSVPREIRHFKELRTLDLGANQLSSIPAWIGELKKLDFLRLYKNKLKSIPQEINELKDLRILELHDNLLQKLDLELPKLERFWLQRNPLKQLSLKADSLTELRLNETIKGVLDLSACSLKKIKFLLVEDNQIHHITPETFKVLKNVEHLNLGSNDLTEIPEGIEELKNVRKITLSGNCFEEPLEQVLNSPLMDIESLKSIKIINASTEKVKWKERERIRIKGKRIVKEKPYTGFNKK